MKPLLRALLSTATISTVTWLAGCASGARPAEGAPQSGSSEPAMDPGPAHAEPASAQATSVFLVHQVPDFDAYLKQFAQNADAREKAGVRRVLMARLTNDPTRVALHFSGGSLESVESFLASSDYDRLVEEDQATNSSLLWIATDELDELPADVPRGSVSLFKKFPLPDFECAKKALIQQQATLRTQGIVGISLHRTTVGTDTAVLHVVAVDRATAQRAYAGDPLASSLAGCGASAFDQPVLADNQTDF